MCVNFLLFSSVTIYTGTKSNGTLQDVGNCTDWTDGVGPGSTHVANNNAVDGEWMEALALTMCSNTAKVYCLSTDQQCVFEFWNSEFAEFGDMYGPRLRVKDKFALMVVEIADMYLTCL